MLQYSGECLLVSIILFVLTYQGTIEDEFFRPLWEGLELKFLHKKTGISKDYPSVKLLSRRAGGRQGSHSLWVKKHVPEKSHPWFCALCRPRTETALHSWSRSSPCQGISIKTVPCKYFSVCVAHTATVEGHSLNTHHMWLPKNTQVLNKK